MTIKVLFEKLMALKPHAYNDAQLLDWLTRIEGQIFADIILTHENLALVDFAGYTIATDKTTTDLIVREPHDDLYFYYLASQIDLFNQELDKFNNNAELFNECYSRFENFWNKNHMPVQKVLYWPI